ncbi:nitroreductase/quinone reductase family protein [Nostocoides sp. F2B08]|uniref:nitroreductase/quinone reductase family protein n=1 Tax=Nostocoides sp. F2B08 TaxID=2653936 RepID=UPI00186ADFE1|nr:nitroreductase/quinone reductase family protein [Tetrasphaera sp. F2B08]
MAYRSPARWYAWLNHHLGAALARLGLLPSGVVALEVTGRRSGTTRRTLVVLTDHDGDTYLVALAGESQWVRNVRAASGHAVLRRRAAHPVRLEELDAEHRAPVILAYLAQAERRGGQRSRALQAESYFGLDPEPTVADVEAIASYYPVFRVHPAAG